MSDSAATEKVDPINSSTNALETKTDTKPTTDEKHNQQIYLAAAPPASSHSKQDKQDKQANLRAWSYVLATFFLFNSAWGLTQTFGAFQEIYLDHLIPGTSASTISWIGSVQSALVITLGAFVGPLFDAGFFRPLLCVGCFMIVFGMAMLSLATEFYQIFLAQAVCVGVGAGLVYVPSLALISISFPESSRPWAIGLANGGGSVGGIIFAFILRQLEPRIGFGWTVRVMALVCLVLAAMSLSILLPYKHHSLDKKRALLDTKAFTELPFMLFAGALLFNYIAFYIPAFFIPTYATTALGQSQDFALDCLIYVSVGSFTGRTIPMLFASRLGSIQIYITATVIGAIVIFSWIAVDSPGGLIAISLIYGLISGTLVAAPSAAISHPVLSPSLRVVGTRLGMGWMFGGVGVLIGAPIAGALADVQRADFTRSEAFAGAMMVVGGLCLVWPLIVIIRYNRRQDR